MNDLASSSIISSQPSSGAPPRGGEAFFEPIGGQWIGRDGERPIGDWIRSLPNTGAGLSTIDRWPGDASIDELVGRAAGEALAQVRTDHAGLLPGGDALARVGVVDTLRSESDSIRAGYALGSLAAAIEQRIAEHPGVPSDTAAKFAAELRERGAAMSFGAAREATADPNVFAFRGVCYASEDAMVGAVMRAMNDPNATYIQALTPEMEQAGRIAEMDRAFWTAPRSPLGMTWAETAYGYARGAGAGPEGLERAYALGATGDALLGVGGALAGAGAARTGFRAPGAQPGPLVPMGRVQQATEGVRPPTTSLSSPSAAPLAGVPGRVQSRINLMQGTHAQGAGWDHVVTNHFNPAKTGKSQFTMSQSDVRALLQSRQVVDSPIVRVLESARGPRYVREVALENRTVGTDVTTSGATSTFTVMTDQYGNLVTTFPGRIVQ